MQAHAPTREVRGAGGIPRLADTLASQDDLEALCADRPQRTREIFTPNAYYGCDAVVKRWAGLPHTYRLKIAIAHGVAFKLAFFGRREHVPVLTYQWDEHRDALRDVGVTGRLEPMASPFVYADELVRSTGSSPGRAGTIAFLARVGAGTPAEVLRGRALDLLALPDELQPVSVCLRWQDVVAGNHVAFQQHGLRVVSAGHIHDPHFLYRLAHLFSIHEQVASDGMGSHIFYGVHAGLRYVDVLTPADPSAVEPGRGEAHAPSRLLRASTAIVASLAERDLEGQRAAVAPLVGAHHRVAPAALRRQLLRAELADKIGVRRPGAGVALPDVVRRPLRRTARRLVGARA